MTKTIAAQAASFTLAALVTVATLMGVGAVAEHQRVESETVALQQAMTQTASIQNVVVIGRRVARV